MRQRVTRNAVGPGLQHDELRREVFQMTQDLLPGDIEGRIVGTRRQRNIELGTRGGTPPDFIARTGAGIEMSTILVDIGKDHRRVGLETVKKTIAMVCVDVDISDPLQPMFAAQPLDEHTAIVERTKPRRAPPGRMVQPRDRHESPPCSASHHGFGGMQHAADHI